MRISFKEFLAEGREEAEAIRKILKDSFKLSSRDVSVKSQIGAVNIKLKSVKSLQSKTKIENIAKDAESYDTDDKTGEILSGGNTFIFVELDDKLASDLKDKIQAEYEKQKSGFENGNRITLFGVFNITQHKNELIITAKGKNIENNQEKYIGSSILTLINSIKDDTIYSKIK